MTQNIINYKAIFRILGIIILIIGISMIIPLIYAMVNGMDVEARSFMICAPGTILIGGLMMFFIRDQKAHFRAREGYMTVALCWICASFLGAFPYFISGFAPSFIDAFFESTSGFTTTSCTAVSETLLPRALLLWKAISHWLGGMGILVFIISLLPALGINGQYIIRAEAPIMSNFEKPMVRTSDSAKLLYASYISLSLLEVVLLMISGRMPLFDAVINTMGSMSTGGLTIHPEGISFYDSVYVEVIISIFCILASINFVLYYYLIKGRLDSFFKDIELRVFLMIIGIAVLLCTFSLIANNGMAFPAALREAFFQVVSTSTTTGFVRTPDIVWPSVCQIVLIALLCIGGCASSTSGSIKVVRFTIMIKLIRRGCVKRIHPRSVVAVKLGHTPLSVSLISTVITFIFTFIGIFLLSAFILSFQGLDLQTTYTATMAILSNTGTAFGEGAAMGDFSAFHPVLKFYLSMLMIVGRLELYTIIVFFTRNFWGKNR